MKGFTLVEMLVSMAVMAVMAAIVTMSYTNVIGRAERVACTGNLRVLHSAFSTYVQDNGSWPQQPEEIKDDVQFYGWIVGEVKDFGGERAAWMCPSEERERMLDISSENFVGSYVPTLFAPGQNTPWLWDTQPWLIERASNHKGGGGLLIMPDSSVHTIDEAVALMR
ncbi:MAG: type II secretion system protein [Verrucomicrobiota bacterium]